MWSHLLTGTVQDVIELASAQEKVLLAVQQASPVVLPIQEAYGLVLAENIVSREEVPHFANSAVDGFAVRAQDVANTPATLRVVDEIAAGGIPNVAVGPGEASRIMTGAPMPNGADAVVMVEDSTEDTTRHEVVLHASVQTGQAVRPRGDDVHIGDVVFRVGDVLHPAAVGVLASINVYRVSVTPRLRVAVLSTGDELVDDGSPLALGQIRESNRTMLMGLVTQAGCEAVDYGIVRDNEQALEETLRTAASECDAIVTSGGVSMGAYDVVKALLGRIAHMTWMQIAIKPAKPFAFGMLDAPRESAPNRQVPIFGLPGNPVSSLVSFELLARPALRKMMGKTPALRAPLLAVADSSLPRKTDGKVHFQRVVAKSHSDGHIHVAPVSQQGSHQLAASALANAVAVLPDGNGVAAGGEVRVLLLSDLVEEA
ncbi:MAG: molybdopterin molybdenumtransferase MoeA [Actinobacteria bacterium]|nr:molybdopterin molybdenumtransferase MoeA [Actinomycetota bacterium]